LFDFAAVGPLRRDRGVGLHFLGNFPSCGCFAIAATRAAVQAYGCVEWCGDLKEAKRGENPLCGLCTTKKPGLYKARYALMGEIDFQLRVSALDGEIPALRKRRHDFRCPFNHALQPTLGFVDVAPLNL